MINPTTKKTPMTRMTRVTQKGHPGKISLSVISMYLAFPEDRSKRPTQNMQFAHAQNELLQYSQLQMVRK